MTNLYEEQFQAALGGKEHRGFLTAFREGKVAEDVKSHVDDLQWCSALVLCYPTWWYSFPAVLKVNKPPRLVVSSSGLERGCRGLRSGSPTAFRARCR